MCALFLGACASLSESECQRGNWEQVGFRDGQNGRSMTRFDEHREACMHYGVPVAELPYRAGRDRGLNFYCTPSNALAVGRRGESYAGVCSAQAERRFLPAFEVGRDIYVARQRVERIEQDRQMIEARLAAARTREEARYWSSQMARTEMERDFAWMDMRWREERAMSVRN
jgi:hypothetical protein